MQKIELNGFIKYGELFQFMHGDTISWNGRVMSYTPSKENKDALRKIPRGMDSWHAKTSIEIPYQLKNQIAKKIEKEGAGIFSNMTIIREEKGQKMSFFAWRVDSAKQDPNLVASHNALKEVTASDDLYAVTGTLDKISIKAKRVEKRTANQVVLKDAAFYKSKWPTADINKVGIGAWYRPNPLTPEYSCLCDMDHMDEMRDQIIAKLTASAESLLKKAQENQKKLASLREKEGY